MIGASGLGKLGKEAREISVRLDAIGADGFDQRVQSHARGGADHAEISLDTNRAENAIRPFAVERSLCTSSSSV
jgi:hypothetical protein